MLHKVAYIYIHLPVSQWLDRMVEAANNSRVTEEKQYKEVAKTTCICSACFDMATIRNGKK